MKLFLRIFLVALASGLFSFAQADPLRVFIRAGVKTHGPGQHDHPRFLGDYTKLLQDRGVQVEGGMSFPSASQLEKTDVLVIFAADGMKIVGDDRAQFEKYLRRGGGLVVLHDGVVSGDQHEFAKKVQGGAWRWDGEKRTKWLEAEVGLYFVDPTHPIVKGVSNFDWKDEIYYDLDMSPDVKVLATSFHSVFIIAPQMWTYEKTWEGGSTPYRAFVSLPGHEYVSFLTPHYRAMILRGIAWAGKRPQIDEFCQPEELAEKTLKYPPGGPTHPDAAGARLGLHPEFNLNLVASEPLVEKVISVDWDAKGRMWVAETPEYPGGRTLNKNDRPVALWAATNPGAINAGDRDDRTPRDRVSWLEDTDGDGRMDRKHVFADGLELVTSLVFYKDGVIVSQAPDILWLRDANGDGRCDMKEGSEKVTLYTGFGTFDTHAVINNFRWGLDGWIYSAIGYSAGTPKSPVTGKEFGRVTAGIIRFKPDGSELEQYTSGSCNTWGFDFAPDGEAFYTTATCGEHFLHIVMPEKVLARGNVGGVRSSWVVPDHQEIKPAVRHTRPAYVQIDWVGFFTAAAGSCIYNGGTWPDRWTGSHFTSETTMSLVHNEFLRATNSTYVASKEPGREETEFIAGNDLWFRPVHTRVGPDGALYVVDLYNQAAIHNDTRGPAHGARNAATRPDRDHHFARIWRVQHKQARALSKATLDSSNASAWVEALRSDNGWTRDTAARFLRESGASGQVEALIGLVRDASLKAHTRIAALHTLASVGKASPELLVASAQDGDAVVRKNALRAIAERDTTTAQFDDAAVRKLLADSDQRVRLNTLIALGSSPVNAGIAREVVAAWTSFKDKHQQSAAVGLATREPALFLEAAFRSSDPAFLADFVHHVVRNFANRQDAEASAKLVVALSAYPATTDGLKRQALETLATTLRAETVPAWNDTLSSALRALLQSNHPGLPGAALPLVARWDKNHVLASDLKPVIGALGARLKDATLPDDQRGQVAANLLGVRALDTTIVPSVGAILGSPASLTLQRRVIEALGATGDASVASELLGAFPKLGADLREAAFGQLVKRSDWASATVQALADRKFDAGLLGPANLHRLRTHADKAVATRANSVIDELKGPEQKQKDALIARLTPEVEKAGNLENGKKLFLANCAGCHKFKSDGADFAPNLTGMGAHGVADLLVHVLDPNRLVEPNFVAVNVETKDDQTLDGIVLRENNAAVIVRNQTGEYEVRKDNIKSRTNTGRSLMPEGFEQLGGEGLRDLLYYLAADELRFRILDLTPVFTATTTEGIYNSKESREESLRFRRYGTIKVDEIPFDIISPQRSTTGKNVLVLRGGAGIARAYPQRVDVKVGVPAAKVHFLGGVGGWAYPYEGDKHKDLPVAKITLRFRGGATEEIVLRNGVEIADYIGRFDVPGSKALPNLDSLLNNGRQLRYFSKPVQRTEVVESLSIESYNNAVAPTFVGLTIETPSAGSADGKTQAQAAAKPAAQATPAPAPASAAAPAAAATVPVPTREARLTPSTFIWGRGKKSLLIGGGASHDYGRWFNLEDVSIIKKSGFAFANYTELTRGLEAVVPDIDVLVLSNNRAYADDAAKASIFAHADAGKGIVLLHAGLWYNWPDWREYNRVLCGGGSRGHDRYGEFEVTVTDPEHPLMKGVPAKFTLADELYYFEPDATGTPIKVLATAHSKQRNKTYPMVFVVEHPKARVAAITLGHDGVAHSHPAYQRLLLNSLQWVTR